MASRFRARCAVWLFAGFCVASSLSAARPVLHHGPLTVSLRDGEGVPPEVARKSPRKGGVHLLAERRTFDARAGNNYEAALQARGCRGFLETYLPDEVTFGDVRFYLKLVADENAELALEDGGALRGYRAHVEIAYLIVSVDGTAWATAPDRFRRSLCTMFLPMLRSLYGHASLYVTVHDGAAAVANVNWKPGARSPEVELN